MVIPRKNRTSQQVTCLVNLALNECRVIQLLEIPVIFPGVFSGYQMARQGDKPSEALAQLPLFHLKSISFCILDNPVEVLLESVHQHKGCPFTVENLACCLLNLSDKICHRGRTEHLVKKTEYCLALILDFLYLRSDLYMLESMSHDTLQRSVEHRHCCEAKLHHLFFLVFIFRRS